MRGEAVFIGNVQLQRLLDLPGLAQQVAEADAVVADVAVGVCACRHEEGELAAEAVSDRAGFAGAGLMRAQRGKGFLHVRDALVDVDEAEQIEGAVPFRLGLVGDVDAGLDAPERSEEHTSELQSLMRISYAVSCLNKKIHTKKTS